MYRTVGVYLVSLLACSSLLGCVESHRESDRLVMTNHWSAMLPLVIIGATMLALGTLLLTGRLRPKGKPRLLGTLLLVFGFLFSVGSFVTTPFDRVAVDRQTLFIQDGVLGHGYRKRIDLTNVQSMRLYKKWNSSHGGRRGHRGRRRLVTVVEFTSHQGLQETVLMDGELRRPALEYLLSLAPDLGIEIIDQRDQWDAE